MKQLLAIKRGFIFKPVCLIKMQRKDRKLLFLCIPYFEAKVFSTQQIFSTQQKGQNNLILGKESG